MENTSWSYQSVSVQKLYLGLGLQIESKIVFFDHLDALFILILKIVSKQNTEYKIVLFNHLNSLFILILKIVKGCRQSREKSVIIIILFCGVTNCYITAT